MAANVVAGIDIGGTNTRIGLVDENGNIVINSRYSFSTTDFPDPKKFVIAVADKIKSLFNNEQQTKNSKLLGVGIGAPNGNYFKGTIEYAPNLQWKGVVPLVEYFKKQINVPILLTNDAKAAALG